MRGKPGEFARAVCDYFLVHNCACSAQQLAAMMGRSKTHVQRIKSHATFAEYELRKVGNMETYRPTLEYMAGRLREALRAGSIPN